LINSDNISAHPSTIIGKISVEIGTFVFIVEVGIKNYS